MRGRGREKLNWKGLFLIVWEDPMEAPGSFEEWEVCFHTTCSEVTKLAASRCNVGPNRANCFQKTVHTTRIYPGPFIAKTTAVVLGSECP